MIPRYTRPEMGRIWTDENKFKKWLQIEILACEAWAEMGKIPLETLREIKEKARFDIERIEELEKLLDRHRKGELLESLPAMHWKPPATVPDDEGD